MTKKERMLKYLNEGECEYTLCSFWHHFQQDKWFGDASINAHLKYYEATGVDFLKIMEEVRYDYPFKNSRDWKTYMPPKRKTKERTAQTDIIKSISDKIGDSCMIYTTVFDPLRSVGIVKGYEYIESHIKENQKYVTNAFKAFAYSISEYAIDCIEAGADGIFFSSKGAEIGRFSEETFSDIVNVPDRYICDVIAEKSRYTILHICGHDTELNYYYDYPAKIVNWDCHNGRYKLNDGAAIFPEKVILGGMENHSGVLTDGTKEEIEYEVNKVIKSFKASNKFILGADCTLPEEVEYERIKTAVEACHKSTIRKK